MRERDRRGAIVWGNPVPRVHYDPQEVRRKMAEFDRDTEYRENLTRDLCALERRIVRAFHFFGTCGVPESEKSAALRRDNPDEWWRLMDTFFDIMDAWAEKLDEAMAIRLRHVPDPPDLYSLIRCFLTNPAPVDTDPDGAVH